MNELLEIDRADFVDDGRTPQRVRHHLAEHPLLSVEAVAQLADRLPEASVEHNVAKDIGVVVPGGAAPVLSQTPGDVARGIETNGCWMVLKQVQQDPEYGRLLNDALDEVAPLLPGGADAMKRRQGFIFLSAPDSVTPAHTDPEHNFLLQIRGAKTMHVGRFATPQAEERELERSYGHGHRNMEYAPEWTGAHELLPGDGLYVPIGKPHWVQNGSTVSVSLSITWRSEDGLRAEQVYAFNDRLRRLGLSPRSPGSSLPVDKGKAFAQKAYEKTKHLASRGSA